MSTKRQPPLTTPQPAEALGLAVVSVRQAILRGRLKATKHGRDWVIEPAEVERYRRDYRASSSPAIAPGEA